jgi:plasmid maintenance system antidote protein VapI
VTVQVLDVAAVKAELRRHGITQRALAEHMHVPEPVLSDMLNRKGRQSAEMLYRVALSLEQMARDLAKGRG